MDGLRIVNIDTVGMPVTRNGVVVGTVAKVENNMITIAINDDETNRLIRMGSRVSVEVSNR